MKRLDLSKVSITDHAFERWSERFARERREVRPALIEARRPGQRLRRRIRVWSHRMTNYPTVRGMLVRVNRDVGVVFVLKTSNEAETKWCVVTVWSIAEIDRAFGLIDGQEEPCHVNP